eukprot:359596-Chlamydomonas_euryale.AAC.3
MEGKAFADGNNRPVQGTHASLADDACALPPASQPDRQTIDQPASQPASQPVNPPANQTIDQPASQQDASQPDWQTD